MSKIRITTIHYPPTQAKFLEFAHGFWPQAEKIAKKIRRGEFYSALHLYANLQRFFTLPMLEWHAKMVYGPNHDTWFAGRYLEKWADPRVLAKLPEVFPHYDEEDIQRALLKNMQLFRWLARETADHLGYPYPDEPDRRISGIIRELFSQA